MRAIDAGNPFQVKACQEFYLRASESLRRLDAAIEIERRKADEQVPKFLVEQISTQISEWLRASFQEFLSSESRSLMGIKDHGEFRARAVERFRSILHTVVKSGIKTNPLPNWATVTIGEAWNISNL